MNKLDLSNQKFHFLTAIEPAEHPTGRTAWRCRCDCGNIKIIKTDELRSGDTKSCGCWNDKARSERAKKMYSSIIKYTPVEASAHKIWKANYPEMPYEDFYKLSQMNCYYCDEGLSNYQNPAAGKNSSGDMKENGYFRYNGLDRFNNNLPHSKDNCVPCCKYCNYSKRERSFHDFLTWIEKINKKVLNGDFKNLPNKEIEEGKQIIK